MQKFLPKTLLVLPFPLFREVAVAADQLRFVRIVRIAVEAVEIVLPFGQVEFSVHKRRIAEVSAPRLESL